MLSARRFKWNWPPVRSWPPTRPWPIRPWPPSGPYFTFMFLVSIFLKNMGKTTNVSIWSIHITWSVHPWREQVYRKEALELFAEQMVSNLSSNITIRKYLNATFTNCYYSHGTYWRSHIKTHGPGTPSPSWRMSHGPWRGGGAISTVLKTACDVFFNFHAFIPTMYGVERYENIAVDRCPKITLKSSSVTRKPFIPFLREVLLKNFFRNNRLNHIDKLK